MGMRRGLQRLFAVWATGRGSLRRWIGAAVLALAIGGTVLAVGRGNPSVRPLAAAAGPSGAVSAPDIRTRLTGVVQMATGAASSDPQAVAVDFTGPSHGWAIVGCGYGQPWTPTDSPTARPCTVIGTGDGGVRWHTAFTTTIQIDQISFPTAAAGFVWTGPGFCPSGDCPTRIYATTDGGRTWTSRYPGPDAFSSMAFLSPTAAWAVSAGALMRSTDGARTWIRLATGACRFQNVAFRGGIGIAPGTGPQGGCAYRTTDAGGTWSSWISGLNAPAITPAFQAFIQNSGLAQTIGGTSKAVAQCTMGTAWPMGRRSAWLTVLCNPINPDMLAVLHTSDGGASWRLAWSTPGCAMNCQAMGRSESPLFFLGDAVWRAAPGGVERSTDSGRTWSTGGPLCTISQCLPSLDFPSANTGFAATSAGVFATATGGVFWHRIWPSSGPGPLAAVSLVTDRTGFAVPTIAQGKILETRDGGITWRAFATVPTGVTLTSLDFLSIREGFAVGSRQGESVLYFTGNGGRSFHPVPLPKGPFGPSQVARIAFVSPKTGLMTDAFGDAWRTTDGGRHWMPIGRMPLGRPQVAAWTGAHRVYATVFLKTLVRSGSRPRIGGHFGLVASRNGARTWQPVTVWPWPPGKGQFNSTVLAAYGNDLWMFAYGGLLHSTDGGHTWTEIRLPASHILPKTLSFADPTHGWLLTAEGRLLMTIDGGKTWQQVALSH